MKKLSISLLIALMGLGFVSCSDDDDSSAGKNGDKCTQNSDCASNYCESGKCAPAKAADGSKCKVDSDCVSNLCQKETCVAQKNDKRDVGQECESNDDCKSNKCDETTHKCVAAEPELKADGADCSKNDECKSNKCDETTHKCVADTTEPDKKADGEDCTKNDECKSNKCDETTHKCVAAEPELKADGADCSAADECKSNKCEAGKCVAATTEPTKKADGETCTAHDECNSSICHKGTCGVPATCSVSDEDYCAGNIYVHCDVDLTTGGEAENEPTFVVNSCGQSKACVVSGTNKGCFETCTEAGKTKTACDTENNTTEDNHPKELVSYQCTQVDDKLVFVVGETRDCGNALCDTFTNSCSGEAAVGVKCQDDNQCNSSYCEKAADAAQGVCADKKAADAACTRDSACQSGYCKESTHKCTARVENDAACDVNADCTSRYCSKTGDATKGKCAAKPSGLDDNGAACTDSAKCSSGYCNGTVCADKPVSAASECDFDRQCAEGKICNATMACVAKTGNKGGYYDSCNADTDCIDGMKCQYKKCTHSAVVDSKANGYCTKASSTCVDNILIKCVEDESWDGGDDMGWGATSYSAETTVCARKGKVCATSGNVTDCMAPCDKIGASYVECDAKDHLNIVTYTCTQVGTDKYFVPKYEKCSGIGGCNTSNNSAKCN